MKLLFVTDRNAISSFNNGYFFLRNGRKIHSKSIQGVISFVEPKIILRVGIPTIHVCRHSLIPYNLKVSYPHLMDLNKEFGRIGIRNLETSRKILAKNSRFVWIKNWMHLSAVLRFPRLLELTLGAVSMLLIEDGRLSVNPFSVVRIGKTNLFAWEVMFAPLLSTVIGRELGSALGSDQSLSNDPKECSNIVMSYLLSSKSFDKWYKYCISRLFWEGVYKPNPSKSHGCFAPHP